MASRRTDLLTAIALCMAFPVFAAGSDNDSKQKLNPEATTSGDKPLDVNNLSKYSKDMLTAFLDAFQHTPTPEAQENAKKISAYLRSIGSDSKGPKDMAPGSVETTPTLAGVRTASSDSSKKEARSKEARSRIPATAGSGSSSATKTPELKNTSVHRGATVTLQKAPMNWLEKAQSQLRDFWIAEPTSSGGPLKSGEAYDPYDPDHKVVRLKDYSLPDQADIELTNTKSGNGAETRPAPGR